jgi:hypothetical protein
MKTVKLKPMGGSAKATIAAILKKAANRSPYYIFDQKGRPVPARDVVQWANYFAECPEKRLLKCTRVGIGVKVSTVFAGVDQDLLRRGLPLLWETMIFGGLHHHYCKRYATRKEALAGHAAALKIAGSNSQPALRPIKSRRGRRGQV